MIRTFFRLAAYIFMTLAAITAILDAAASVASSRLTIMSFGDFYLRRSKNTGPSIEADIANALGHYGWSAFDMLVLQPPSWLVFGIISIILYWIGFKRPARIKRIIY